MKRISIIVMLAVVLCGSALASIPTEEQQPLVVVNGKVMTMEEVKALDSNKIESMTVIKDAAQLAEYATLGDTSNGVVVISLYEDSVETTNSDEPVFISAEVMPTFMGGDLVTFQNWVMHNLRYPAEALELGQEEMVIVTFTVDREGYIPEESIKILQSKYPLLANEVRRVMLSTPRWTPAIQKGKPVAVSFTLPVQFTLSAKK